MIANIILEMLDYKSRLQQSKDSLMAAQDGTKTAFDNIIAAPRSIHWQYQKIDRTIGSVERLLMERFSRELNKELDYASDIVTFAKSWAKDGLQYDVVQHAHGILKDHPSNDFLKRALTITREIDRIRANDTAALFHIRHEEKSLVQQTKDKLRKVEIQLWRKTLNYEENVMGSACDALLKLADAERRICDLQEMTKRETNVEVQLKGLLTERDERLDSAHKKEIAELKDIAETVKLSTPSMF